MGKTIGKSWENEDLPSGNEPHFAIENGHRRFVTIPIQNADFPYVHFPEGSL